MRNKFGQGGLYLKGHIYHFRIVVPEDLRHITRCREVKRSLKTSDLSIARRLAFDLREDILIMFQRMRGPKAKTAAEKMEEMAIPVRPEGDGMETLIEYWESQAPRSKKTLTAVKQAARLWGEKFPTVGPTQATRQHVLEFRDHLLKTRDPKTVSKLIALLATVFQTACDGGKLKENPFAKIRIVLPKVAAKKRLPFTAGQMKLIVGALPEEDPNLKWVTLIGAFTGARIAEIAGLRVQDVREEDGVWIIDINANGRSLKTATSERVVPIHQGLIDRGFVGYLEGRKKVNGHLFDVDDAVLSKRFGRFLNRIGLDDKRLVFHSWRHSFITIARQCGIDFEVRSRLTGHATKTVGEDYGLMPLETLADAVRRMRFPV